MNAAEVTGDFAVALSVLGVARRASTNWRWQYGGAATLAGINIYVTRLAEQRSASPRPEVHPARISRWVNV